MHKGKKKVKLYQIQDVDEPIVFWSAWRPKVGEKLLKTKQFDLPLKEGFYGKDYLSPTDVEFVKKEMKRM